MKTNHDPGSFVFVHDMYSVITCREHAASVAWHAPTVHESGGGFGISSGLFVVCMGTLFIVNVYVFFNHSRWRVLKKKGIGAHCSRCMTPP